MKLTVVRYNDGLKRKFGTLSGFFLSFLDRLINMTFTANGENSTFLMFGFSCIYCQFSIYLVFAASAMLTLQLFVLKHSHEKFFRKTFQNEN